MGIRRKSTTLTIFAILAGAVLIAATVIAAAAALPEDTSEQTAVAEVNGDIVTLAELAHFAQFNRASVIEAYLTEDGAEMDENFWKKEFRGMTPIETLRGKALDEAVRMKIELQLAREFGFVSEVSYDSLLEAMKEENARRAAAIANAEPLYGPAKFEESTFIDFYRSKLAALVKERWAESVLRPDEEELRSYYESMKSSIAPMEDRMTYERITISYRHEGEDSEWRIKDAFKVATAVREHLLAGDSAAEAAAEPASLPSGITAVYDGEMALNEDSASRLYKSENALYLALRDSSAEHPVPAVIDDRAAGRYVVVRVTGREETKDPAFEEVRDQVRKLYIEGEYAAYVQSRAELASVQLLPAFDETMFSID
ncbi:hypothetical protein RB620_10610 [Paenibacillus sp. LHD-117]|uniref:hypothetical protein n=1 Tax=Paenibacillus sp. LHD-117 TaxID=3071412 RepID=UPI0027E12D0B|nr:hypothetical protein [Paenibacillus sp. LHD-117]MDQ6419884.1 hypothetical protein [Paenibacillus sp. LHD-117]